MLQVEVRTRMLKNNVIHAYLQLDVERGVSKEERFYKNKE